MKNPRLFLLVSVLSAAVAACTTFGSSDSDGGVEPSNDAQADTSVTIPGEAGALDASSPDSVAPGVDAGGRSWKAFFVTSGKTTGDLAGTGDAGTDALAFAKADQMCNAEAASAGLRGQFLAVVRSDKNSSLTERVKSSTGPRFLPKAFGMQGPIVVADIASTTPLALTNPPNVYASGEVAPIDTRVWTGGSLTSASPAFCSASSVAPWTFELAGVFGTVGDPSKTDGQVADVTNVNCNQPHSLYCVEK